MKRADIVAHVASQGTITKRTAEALARGEDDTVMGFCRFARTERPPREGRNPRTGDSIAIGPSSGVSFMAGEEGRMR